jgi:hypothetical protein
MRYRLRQLFGLSVPLFALGACDHSPVAPLLTASIISVVPGGGATGVDRNAPIVVVFSHAMQAGMERYEALHEGTLTGPTVPGVREWWPDRTRLKFTPAEPLQPATQYTLHLGGGMRAADGGFVDYGACPEQHGGRWATRPSRGSGMMGGGEMMGAGWRHPNGSYGMVFTFTTA